MKNVRTVALFSIVVDDYDRAIRHYCQDLGFELVTDIDQGRKRFVIIRPAGAPPGAAGIVLAEASDDNQRSRIGNQTGGRVGFFLHTDNFARDHVDRIDYYAYLQWNAQLQLSAAQDRAKAAGMRIGLYLDLAVGVVPGGSDVWRRRGAFADEISLGAPGDAANPDGQRWNLLPLRPDKFDGGEDAEQAFRAALRAVMVPAGAIRIDHVLGLSRSFWIPDDTPGGYVTYPFARLMRIIAEESQAAHCIIFGEDLGTVPDGFRDQMAAYALLGCSVQMIERGHHGELLPREAARRLAMNAWSNHDFPTVAGFWTERDLAWREQLGIGLGSLPHEREQRAQDRRDMASLAGLPDVPDTLSAEDMAALQAYLAGGASLACAVQLDDLLLSEDQPNVPGTTSEQPNWRRRTTLPLEQILTDPDAALILRAIAAARPQP